MKTSKFWKDSFERAVKTFAQSAVAIMAVSTSLFDVSWMQAAGTAGLAALVSLLTSIGSAGVGSSESASLVVDTKDKGTSIEPF
ncbi:metallophosphoesterase [Streptomyces phage Wofford]|uniref:Metallophosphoesterase n=1 Tax=Streptomyces phage Wofford TaxID=2283267 RepID=A0A345M9U1_9CAUD|nr:holin [Streptomyces phage Wollford]AXH67262.1 metallophosphoesterase [Streptomyces phage Wollford]